MSYVLAWWLALALGLAAWWLLAGRPRTAIDWLAAIGYAVVMGILLSGLSVRIPVAWGLVDFGARLWLLPVAALAVLALAAALRRPAPGLPPLAPVQSPVAYGWFVLLVVLVGLRAVWLIDEAWLRPLFGWDAWVAWSAKAKTWVLDGQVQEFVSGGAWLNRPDATVRTSLAWHYPELLSWVQVWLASAAGGWYEPMVLLAWPILWLALLLGCYGQWRNLGVRIEHACIGTWLLASLPLINVHAALPGYADLWLAAVLVFAALAWLRWRERREKGQLLLAIALTAILPMIKAEGMVWALAFAGLMLWFDLVSIRRRWRTPLILSGLLIVLLLTWWLRLPVLDVLAGLLTGQGNGQGVSFVSVLKAMLAGLFLHDNWNLLWYLLPAVVLWRWRVLRSMPAVAGLAIYLLAGLLLILALFGLTVAGEWAERQTAINRLVMHLAPIAVCIIVLVLRGYRFPGDAAESPEQAAADHDPEAHAVSRPTARNAPLHPAPPAADRRC